MKPSKQDKTNIISGVVILIMAAFFSISLLVQALDFGIYTTNNQNILYILGKMLFSVYGFSSILIPVFFLIAGLSCFASTWTARKAFRLLTAIVPFFTCVICENICRAAVNDSYSDFLGVKIAVVLVTGIMLVIIEFIGAGIIADKISGKSHAKIREVNPGKTEEKEAVNQEKENPSENDSENTEIYDEVDEVFENSSSTESSENSNNSTSKSTTENTVNVSKPQTDAFAASTNSESHSENDKSNAEKKDDVKIHPAFMTPLDAYILPKFPEKNQPKVQNEISEIEETPNQNVEESTANISDENKNTAENEKSDEQPMQPLLSEEEYNALITDEDEETEEDELEWKNLPPLQEKLPPDYDPNYGEKIALGEDFQKQEAEKPNVQPVEYDKPTSNVDDFGTPTSELDDTPIAPEENKSSNETVESEENEPTNETMDTSMFDISFDESGEEENADDIGTDDIDDTETKITDNPIDNSEEDDDTYNSDDEIPEYEESDYESPNSDTDNKITGDETISDENDDFDIGLDDDFEDYYEDDEEEDEEDDEFDDVFPGDILDESNTTSTEEADKEETDKKKTDGVSENGMSSMVSDVFEEMEDDIRKEKGLPEEPENPHLAAPKDSYLIPSDLLKEYANDQYWIIDEGTKSASIELRNTLADFNIEAEIIGIKKGPVVTMFEISPAPGVKLSKIVGLQDNIALRLAASSVRIVAPIPGKRAVGIEVPNKHRSIVSFREMIEQDLDEFKKMTIPVILGKDILGKAQLLDLVKTPHLLIAGATGAGKSVCVNSIILSILYKRSPDKVKLILVDPKVVELKLYNNIPHLLTPVITEPKKAFQALQYCLCEMERRYSMLDNMGVRDISSYNARIKERHLMQETLPYIVVIIDEFADLMATTGKELESTVARLAAMSRAVGIHLVLATQRPSVNVITGLIKANIPSRIAFMVASRMDSSIIIDSAGAEKLLGRGDMLYASAVDPNPVRIQGTFVSDEEVESVVNYVKQYGEPDYIDDEIFVDDEDEQGELFDDDENFGDDPLYDQALEIVIREGKASASFIQRKLKIGYNRAARLVEEMEERGIVGPANGSKPREVIHVP